MRDIEALCSRAVIINSGTLVYDGALLISTTEWGINAC